MVNVVEQCMQSVPEPFRDELQQQWRDYSQDLSALQLQPLLEETVFASLCKVWVTSSFVRESCLSDRGLLMHLVESGELFASKLATPYASRLADHVCKTEDDLYRVLRQFRRREMVRIAWRDIAGWSGLEETLTNLTSLAESSIDHALDYYYQKARQTTGPALDSQGVEQRLVVLGMGKLGAWELNFSSDIDLIFAYPEGGEFDDRKGTSYEEYFNRIARRVINALDSKTAYGFVFRVDMRLRPWGSSGSMAMSFAGMEKYYREHGREWERYAMVKARPVAGDIAAGESLQALLQPFVYRPYLDYGVFLELRSLKRQINLELKRKDRVENVKLGPGGIREIEFIVQSYQLIRGGRDPALRERRVMKVLDLLAKEQLLPRKKTEILKHAYVYLRNVEHRLQAYADEQVNDLPVGESKQLRLAFSLDFADWFTFKSHLDALRADVHSIFDEVFNTPQLQDLHPDAERVWLPDVAPDEMRRLLDAMGFQPAEEAQSMVAAFRHGGAVRNLGSKGSVAIDLLIPMVLSAARLTDNPGTTLRRLIAFFRIVAGRSMYLSLLVENPLALSQLVTLASSSPWIPSYIARDPLLLDGLMDPNKLYEPLEKTALAAELEARLSDIDVNDLESQLLELQNFKQTYVLRVAASDITGVIPLIVVSDYLSDIAEVITRAVAKLAWNASIAGLSGVNSDTVEPLAGFAIVGFGRFSSRELSYDSQLDLQLFYQIDEPICAKLALSSEQVRAFYRGVGSRMDRLMSTKTLHGMLYRAHSPIAPTHRQGVLIGSFDVYEQADLGIEERAVLIKARPVAGDPSLSERFSAYRYRALGAAADSDDIGNELAQSRVIPFSRDSESQLAGFNIIDGRGGMVDIETIIGVGVLTELSRDAGTELAQHIETMSLIHGLGETGFVLAEEARQLQKAYVSYRAKIHTLDLQEMEPLVEEDLEVEQLATDVARIYRRLLG